MDSIESFWEDHFRGKQAKWTFVDQSAQEVNCLGVFFLFSPTAESFGVSAQMSHNQNPGRCRVARGSPSQK